VLPNGIGAQRNFNPPIQIELPGAQEDTHFYLTILRKGIVVIVVYERAIPYFFTVFTA